MLDTVDSTADIPPRARYSKPRVSCLHELLIFSSWCPSGGKELPVGPEKNDHTLPQCSDRIRSALTKDMKG